MISCPLVGLWCRLGFCSCTVLLQKKPVRESTQRQMSCSSSGSLSPSNQAANAPKLTTRREWKYIASEKTTSKCLHLRWLLHKSSQKPHFHAQVAQINQTKIKADMMIGEATALYLNVLSWH